jgi:hypothetical protein
LKGFLSHQLFHLSDGDQLTDVDIVKAGFFRGLDNGAFVLVLPIASSMNELPVFPFLSVMDCLI